MDKFLVGSRYFFSCYPDFCPHDEDWLLIVDSIEPFQGDHCHMKFCSLLKNRCLCKIKRKNSKEEYLQIFRNSNYPLMVASLLTPSFAEFLELTIQELKTFENMVKQLSQDRREYKYYELLFYAYLENNSFEITDKQRLAAYNEYKKFRTDRYKSI